MPQGSLRTFLPGVQPGDLIERGIAGLTAATLLRGYDESRTFPPRAHDRENAARVPVGQRADKEPSRPTKY